ncbi:COBRA-like protein [Psidium guajava]|nr:COBRA-like protein [Psidium guajava]
MAHWPAVRLLVGEERPAQRWLRVLLWNLVKPPTARPTPSRNPSPPSPPPSASPGTHRSHQKSGSVEARDAPKQLTS